MQPVMNTVTICLVVLAAFAEAAGSDSAESALRGRVSPRSFVLALVFQSSRRSLLTINFVFLFSNNRLAAHKQPLQPAGLLSPVLSTPFPASLAATVHGAFGTVTVQRATIRMEPPKAASLLLLSQLVGLRTRVLPTRCHRVRAPGVCGTVIAKLDLKGIGKPVRASRREPSFQPAHLPSPVLPTLSPVLVKTTAHGAFGTATVQKVTIRMERPKPASLLLLSQLVGLHTRVPPTRCHRVHAPGVCGTVSAKLDLKGIGKPVNASQRDLSVDLPSPVRNTPTPPPAVHAHGVFGTVNAKLDSKKIGTPALASPRGPFAGPRGRVRKTQRP